VTKKEHLHISLFICEAVLDALIRTHPNKEALRHELVQGFGALRVSAMGEESLGEQEEAYMKASMDAFLSRLDH
jgi:hypothetical protein